VGVKDLFDVAGMPTGCGAVGVRSAAPSPVDASLVSILRAAGADIIGKTEAVEYGWFGHVTTRNPHDPGRSPGGSSSGSAAAVAAGMCRLAVGTQTAGSMIRPAAYCGVPAIKFGLGAVPLDGAVLVSRHLDSAGLFASTWADLITAASVLLPHPGPPVGSGTSPVRVGVLVEDFQHLCTPSVRAAVDAALVTLAASEEVELRPIGGLLDWESLRAHHRALMVHDCARSRRNAYDQNASQFSPVLQEAIREGLALGDDVVEGALDAARRSRAIIEDAGDIDCWLTPAATQEAPKRGLPGDPACQTPFTLMGLPAIHLPAGPGAHGLPVGLQLVGRRGQDIALLRHAAALQGWVQPRSRPGGQE
jgi:Asp-tRNA(Asn)/Glu-tRNA(Gln) amidotransferase A subunit family amidase